MRPNPPPLTNPAALFTPPTIPFAAPPTPFAIAPGAAPTPLAIAPGAPIPRFNAPDISLPPPKNAPLAALTIGALLAATLTLFPETPDVKLLSFLPDSPNLLLNLFNLFCIPPLVPNNDASKSFIGKTNALNKNVIVLIGFNNKINPPPINATFARVEPKPSNEVPFVNLSNGSVIFLFKKSFIFLILGINSLSKYLKTFMNVSLFKILGINRSNDKIASLPPIPLVNVGENYQNS